MMSISQVDMVVWRDRELQVCGDLNRSAEPRSILAVVRQGDNVAALHAARPFDSKSFDPTKGRWELKGTPLPEVEFDTAQPVVVSAVVVLEQEPAGLETLSWVQAVELRTEEPDRPLGGRAQLHFTPEVLAQPPERALEVGHSVLSSLTILQDGVTFRGLQRIDKLPPAVPLAP